MSESTLTLKRSRHNNPIHPLKESILELIRADRLEELIVLSRKIWLFQYGDNHFYSYRPLKAYFVQDHAGGNLLHLAVCAQALQLIWFLVGYGYDINKKDSSGHTPLHAAISDHQKLSDPVPQFLMRVGTDLNIQTDCKNALIHTAIYNNDIESVEMLIKAGMDLNSINGVGFTPLALARAVSERRAIAELLKAIGAKSIDEI